MPAPFRGSRRPLKLFTSVLIAGAALSVGALSAPAGATTTDPTDPMAPGVYDTGTDPAGPDQAYTSGDDGGQDTVTVTVQDTDSSGNVTGPETTVYDSSQPASATNSATVTSGPLPSTSGTGGSPSGSGCRRVSAAVDHNSISGLGDVFKYNERTWFCWDRSSRKITSAQHSWWLSQMGPNCQFVQTLWTRIGNYAWISGYNYSGDKHQRQGQFHIDGYAGYPSTNRYPILKIWVHSNGTFGYEEDS